MDWQPYIHSDPAILVGKPVIKGTRLADEFLLQLYAAESIQGEFFYPLVGSK